MKGKNKKIKNTIKTKRAVKTKKVKKTAMKKKPEARSAKSAKKETILGALALKSENLGTKIEVKEVESLSPAEPIVLDDLAAEPVIPLYNDMVIAQDEPEDDPEDEISDPEVPYTDVSEPMANEDEVSADYYQQKDLSPRVKNIILYVSLAVIFGVLITFWGLNIKNTLSQGLSESFDSQSQSLINDFQNTISGFQDKISQITGQNTNQADLKNPALDDLQNKIISEQVKDDLANQLKEKLENLNTGSAIDSRDVPAN